MDEASIISDVLTSGGSIGVAMFFIYKMVAGLKTEVGALKDEMGKLTQGEIKTAERVDECRSGIARVEALQADSSSRLARVEGYLGMPTVLEADPTRPVN